MILEIYLIVIVTIIFLLSQRVDTQQSPLTLETILLAYVDETNIIGIIIQYKYGLEHYMAFQFVMDEIKSTIDYDIKTSKYNGSLVSGRRNRNSMSVSYYGYDGDEFVHETQPIYFW